MKWAVRKLAYEAQSYVFICEIFFMDSNDSFDRIFIYSKFTKQFRKYNARNVKMLNALVIRHIPYW